MQDANEVTVKKFGIDTPTPEVAEPKEEPKSDPEEENPLDGIPVQGLYQTADGELFVSFIDEHGRYAVELIRGRKFRRFLRLNHLKKKKVLLRDAKLNELVDLFAAFCEFEGEKIKLWSRVAKDGDDIVADGITKEYRISAGKWTAEDLSKPLFKRAAGMKELPIPVPGGDVKKFLDFVYLRNSESKLLLLVLLVASLHPEIPHPVLICYGPQGASKSSLLRFFIAIIDPNLAEDVPFRNEKDFMLAASQRWVLGLDNVSFLDRNVSDIFCKLVTGTSYTARALYTDDDLIIRNFRRVTLINGINLPVEKPDLMDRCVLLQMDRIPPEMRQTESDLNAKFDAVKGEILGGCFDVLAKAIEIHPTINLPTKERMADFHLWGCAIAKALGYTQEDFLNAWAKNIELQHEESLEASPLAVLVSQWFKANPYEHFISGTPSVVFRKLKEQADNAGLDERTLPRSPLAFGRKLQEVRANLEAHGYVIDRTRGKDRTVTIYKPKANISASDASVTSIADAVSNRSAPTVADKLAKLREGRTL